jgi:hypothetical protein
VIPIPVLQIPGGIVVSIVGIINGLINAILPQLGALLPGLPAPPI